MNARTPSPAGEPVSLGWPFGGRWQARNSPATRVPSHGTDLFGTTYAIDFVPVDDRGRSAPTTWRTLLGTEPAARFVGFGRALFAPVDGTVVAVHDGEPDHAAHRSPPAAVRYAIGQAGRLRAGVAALAGNHVVIALAPGGPFVSLAHLQQGSTGVAVGQRVRAGSVVGRCGNSGNSTEPHLHLQVTDRADWTRASGLPFAFQRPGSAGEPWVPADGEIVEVAR